MEKRELGRTREKIPVIGMGTWTMGNAQKGEVRREELQALRKGIELGMTLIDTAEMYGHGNSEQLVGEAIRGIRDEVFVATKVSAEHLGYDGVLMSCESSIRRLGVKYIDLYQIHWPSLRIPIQETMRAMEELVSRGRIRYIGISNFSVEQTQEAQESLPRSEIASNQVRYSLTYRSVESELLPFCEKHRITMIAYSPLDSGKLPESRIPQEMLSKYGMTSAQLMLNWVTYRESVVAIPKTSSVSHAEENAAAVSVRMLPDDYKILSKRFS